MAAHALPRPHNFASSNVQACPPDRSGGTGAPIRRVASPVNGHALNCPATGSRDSAAMFPLPYVRRVDHRDAVARRIAAVALIMGVAAWLTGIGPGESLALVALTICADAGHDRRDPIAMIAAGLCLGLSPLGLVLAPLCFGRAVGRSDWRLLSIGLGATLIGASTGDWTGIGAAAPNLARLALAYPDTIGAVMALTIGAAVWLMARASAMPHAPFLVEARWSVLIMACLLPLSVAAFALVVGLALIPLPAPRRLCAANDNQRVRRRPVRLAA